MKDSKDLFSIQSKKYAKFRPTYPDALFDWILDICLSRSCAWDCGTGNGQVAHRLAPHFDQVIGTDISQKQLDQAIPSKNISYQLSRSEATPFSDQQFDLITVAQALHWFDHAAFNQEVDRVLKPKGMLAVWGYGLLRIHPEIDPLINHYYRHVIGPFWAAERRHVDDAYQSIPFPYQEIESKQDFFIEVDWTVADLQGYLNTWSSLQTYLKTHEDNPVSDLITQIKAIGIWTSSIPIRFPIFIRLGKKP